MSGPAPSEQLYESHNDLQWTQAKVSDLRSLADRIDDYGVLGDLPDQTEREISELLRAKADRIEAALRTIDRETHDSYNELVKAIQYNQSGDYGSERVKEAWESYAEK